MHIYSQSPRFVDDFADNMVIGEQTSIATCSHDRTESWLFQGDLDIPGVSKTQPEDVDKNDAQSADPIKTQESRQAKNPRSNGFLVDPFDSTGLLERKPDTNPFVAHGFPKAEGERHSRPADYTTPLKENQCTTAAVSHDTQTIRGFHASGDRGSSPFKTPSRSISPLRPSTSTSAVSALKMRLDAFNISENPSTVSSVKSYRSSSDLTESYEVPLDHDFISQDAVDGCEPEFDNATGVGERRRLDRKMAAHDFEPLACLGKGSFGTVLLVKHKVSGRLYAQKQFRKASLTVHKRLVEQTKTERAILESVNCHPFVVKLFYAFQDHEMLYLILEYAQGGELFHHLQMERMFSEEVASFYMAEMVLALEHLHQNLGVVYRDLKPENCLLDAEGHLLLADFGLSKVSVKGDERCNSALGTVEYMAPEIVQGKTYGKACDWWSLGALGFDLLTGSPPFKGNNNAKIQERIVKQKPAMPYFLGPDAKDLLTRFLRKEPHKRLGYHPPKDMQTIKNHRFFRKINFAALERREMEPPIKPLVTDPALAENFSEDFTHIPLHEVVEPSGQTPIPNAQGTSSHEDPFGGFSFVASSSMFQDRGIAFASIE